jgi:hypothetical protein
MPSGFLTPENVEREAREHATKVFEDRDTLQKIVRRHEATIRKR